MKDIKMNVKTARRFLSRNKWKLAKYNVFEVKAKSFRDRIEKCEEVINNDKKLKVENGYKNR